MEKKDFEQRLSELEKRQTALEQRLKGGLDFLDFRNKTAANEVGMQKRQPEENVIPDPLKKWRKECQTLALLLHIPLEKAKEHHDTLLEKCKQFGIEF